MSQKDLFKADDCEIDLSTCSTTDCTGLIPAKPASKAELESYEDLYPYLPKASGKSTEDRGSEHL